MGRTSPRGVLFGLEPAACCIQALFFLAVGLSSALPAEASTVYVRVSGNDAASGLSPQSALRTIGRAAAIAKPGDRVVVGPGVYQEGNIEPTAFGLVSFIADRRGIETGDPPGAVVIEARDPTTSVPFSAGFVLNTKVGVWIDGFVVYGATTGIYVKTNSDQARLTDNIVSGNADHGINVQDSKNVLVFNNLSYGNGSSGIILRGSPGGKVINNTVYGNGDRGIFFATDSPQGVALNNAAEGNAIAGIQVNDPTGYVTGGNVSSDRFASGTPRDATDLGATAIGSLLFVDPAGPDTVLGGSGFADDDFRLSQVAAGQEVTSPAVDAGSDVPRHIRLSRASTRTDGLWDRKWVDAGYHYGNFLPPPTARITRRIRFKSIYVDPESGDDANGGDTPTTAFRTLGRALSVAKTGNRIDLRPGVYREGDLSPANSGTPERTIDVQGVTGQTVIDASGFSRGIVISGQSNIRLGGLEVRNSTQSGIEIRNGAANVFVYRCRLYQNARRGVYAENASGVTIRSTLLSQNATRGLALNGSQVDVLRSVIESNGIGIEAFTDSADAPSSELTVTDSQISSNDTMGLRATDAVVDVSGTTIRENGDDGLRQTGGTLRVVDTTLSANRGNGISVDGMSQLTVQSTSVSTNGGNGIQAVNGAVVSITGTASSDNGGDGVTILDTPAPVLVNDLMSGNQSSGTVISGVSTGSMNAQVLNNTFFGNANRGLLLGGSNDQPPSSDATVLRNIFQANAVNGLQVNELSLPGLNGDYNLSADGYGPGTPIGLHDIIVPDALFIDSATGDFRLQQRAAGQLLTSPAVDAGGVSATAAGLARLTTRTDLMADSGTVDLGFHYDPSRLPKPTPSPTATRTRPPTATVTRTSTATTSPTETPTVTPSNTPSPTASATPTATPSEIPTWSPTETRTHTPVPTFSPTVTDTATATVTQTQLPSDTPTVPLTATVTASWTSTESPISTATATRSPTAPATETPSPSASPSSSQAPIPTATATRSPTAPATETPSPSASPTSSQAPIPTATATQSPTGPATETPSPSPSPSSSQAPIPTATATQSPTAPATETPSPSASPTSTESPIPTATATRSPTAPATETPSPRPSPSSSQAPIPTATATPTSSETVTPTWTSTTSTTPPGS